MEVWMKFLIWNCIFILWIWCWLLLTSVDIVFLVQMIGGEDHFSFGGGQLEFWNFYAEAYMLGCQIFEFFMDCLSETTVPHWRQSEFQLPHLCKAWPNFWWCISIWDVLCSMVQSCIFFFLFTVEKYKVHPNRIKTNLKIEHFQTLIPYIGKKRIVRAT